MARRPVYSLIPKILGGLILFFLPVTPLHSLQTPPPGACFVYPSPASGDRVHVVYNMPGSGTCFIKIYNEAGDLIFQTQEAKSAGLQQTTLNLYYYHKGIYLCRASLLLDNGEKTSLKAFKFVVAK